MNILITGGLGYLGTHIASEISKNNKIFILDNLTNSYISNFKILKTISKSKKIYFIKCDILNKKKLVNFFFKNKIDTVIHLAGLKSVEESVSQPNKYYKINILGTLNLLDAIENSKVNKIIFSSSATVYGNPKRLPITEKHPIQKPTNPYGSSKLMIETIIEDFQKKKKNISCFILRYFNPGGAHPSFKIGENPKTNQSNIIPQLISALYHKKNKFKIYGNNFKTKDGTPVRDYIHVMDLAKIHSLLLEKKTKPGYYCFNIGSGKGYSVKKLCQKFNYHAMKILKKKVSLQKNPRRVGDVPSVYASFNKISKFLNNWKPKYSLDDICKSSIYFKINKSNAKR
ncbi:UDP-glucose 4-epimerase GalE [Candidatus Pelagibacter sp. HIMB1517]|uniref:UDP-glucose 4-epimerase GalE n=1 Tax=Candidatus Pelagibacter sp. HIMB1517 TaxID=3413341 RepID=UPI003F848266